MGFTKKNQYYEFFVKDNGVGIHREYYDKIFKLFSKLDSSGLSSGIGLSIVKKIVNYYNGSIWLNSVEGEGSTFYFNFPINN